MTSLQLTWFHCGKGWFKELVCFSIVYICKTWRWLNRAFKATASVISFFSSFIWEVLMGLSTSLFAVVHIFDMSPLSSLLSPVFYALSAYIVLHDCKQSPFQTLWIAKPSIWLHSYLWLLRCVFHPHVLIHTPWPKRTQSPTYSVANVHMQTHLHLENCNCLRNVSTCPLSKLWQQNNFQYC